MRLFRLLAELQRRRVYRVAVAYLVAAFAVLEAVDLVLSAFPVPSWVYPTLVILALTAFPFVVVLAWAFDITPQGVRRDRGGADRDAAGGGESEAASPSEEGGIATVGGPPDLGWTGRPLFVVTVLLGVAGVGAWYAGRSSAALPEPSNPRTLAVLPFVPPTADSALHRLGRDLVITLSSAVGATGDIATTEALAVLARIEPRNPPSTLSAAREAAGALGAEHFLRGAVLRDGARLRLEMTLHETRSLEEVGRSTVTAEDVRTLTDSATLAVLRLVWRTTPDAPPNPHALNTTSTEALRAYLEGERAMAEGRWRDAPEAFARAVAADSSFWFAYWRLKYALDYHGEPVDSLVGARVWEHREALPDKDRLLVEADAAPVGARLEILRETTTRFPTYWPAWWDLSEVLVHHGGYLGRSMDESRAALERTVELHPSFVSAWNHLFWIAARRRDATAMRAVIDVLSSARFDEVSLREGGINTLTFNRAQLALIEGGDEVPASVVETGVQELSSYRGPVSPERIASSLGQAGFLTAQVQVARGILRSPAADDRMRGAQHGILAYALAAQEAWDSALVAADQAARVGQEPADVLLPYRIAVVGVAMSAVPADAARRRRPAALRGDDAPDLRAELAWLDGVVAHAAGDTAGLARVRAALPQDAAGADVLDRSLRILQTDVEGRRQEAAYALAALEADMAGRSLQHEIGPRHPFLNGVHRLTAARWLLEVGDTLAAQDLLRWHEVVLPGPLHRLSLANQVTGTPALRLRGQLAAAAGQDREAAELEALVRARTR